MDLGPRSLSRLRDILVAHPDTLAATAAALWARAGRMITLADLVWANGLGIPDAPQLLQQSLEQAGAIVAGRLDLMGLQRFLALMLAVPVASGDGPKSTLLWTLPRVYPGGLIRGQSLLQGIRQLVHDAKREILFATPYVEGRGIGLISEDLRAALGRRVTIIFVAHDLLDLGSQASQALEPLRRDAHDLPGRLEVFSGVTPSAAPRDEHPLIHSKVVTADDSAAIVSSANLTVYGLTSNFEVGVWLSGLPAQEAGEAVRQLLHTPLVTRVFTSGAKG